MDYGIVVTENGVDASKATDLQKVLNLKYPLMKIDRDKSTSFKNIKITFVNDPPAPAVGTTTSISTQIYKFEHGYTYKPAIWSFCRADGVSGSFSGTTTYFVDSGLIGGSNTGFNFPFAFAYTGCDSQYCYIYVKKFTGTVGPAINLTGALLYIRFYVFAQDVGV